MTAPTCTCQHGADEPGRLPSSGKLDAEAARFSRRRRTFLEWWGFGPGGRIHNTPSLPGPGVVDYVSSRPWERAASSRGAARGRSSTSTRRPQRRPERGPERRRARA